MVAKSKASTKKDLESKIVELEGKLKKLSSQLEAKPAETKPTPAKPAETKPTPAKPAERPAATTKPKGVLPKGMDAKPAEAAQKPAETKPAETKPAERPAATTKPKGVLPKGMDAKPAEVPKPAESDTKAQLAATTVQEALENAYMTAPMTSFHDYRAKVTGYSPAPNRYFVRLTAPVGKVPTKNWNDQKATLTGYTAASNQYYATRARLAYHPADKTFGSFSGINMTVEGIDAKAQQAPPTPEPPQKPKPTRGTLPKGMEQAPQQQQQQSTYSGDDEKTRQDKLADYEADYLKRIEQQKIDDEKAYQELVAAEAKSLATANRGTLPKGFQAKPEPKAPDTSKGTLPKGF